MVEYTYRCNNEGCDIHMIEFIVEQSMKEDSLTKCPDCEHETLKRVIRGSGGFRSVVNGVYRFRKGTTK